MAMEGPGLLLGALFALGLSSVAQRHRRSVQ
jgi:hypothetical protein